MNFILANRESGPAYQSNDVNQLIFSPKRIWINTSGSIHHHGDLHPTKRQLHTVYQVDLSFMNLKSSFSLSHGEFFNETAVFLIEVGSTIETRFYQQSFQGRRAAARSGASSTRVTRGANGPTINVQFTSFPRCWKIVRPILRVICDQNVVAYFYSSCQHPILNYFVSLQWSLYTSIYHLESRWLNSHVLVYHIPLLSHLLGVAPSTFQML